MRHGLFFFFVVVVLGVLSTLLLSSPARGAPAKWRGFYPTGQYLLYVGDTLDEDAKIYHSERAAAYLVVSEKLEVAVMILPRTRCVESVKPDEMDVKDDGGIDILKDVVPCRLGRFRIEGAKIVFKTKKKSASLRPNPPLLGGHLHDELLRHSPQYGRAAKAYKPDPRTIELLKASDKKARIQIFFGSWCPFCSRFLPHTLRVEEELEGADFSFEYFGLPSPPEAFKGDIATRMGIEKLITGIIFIDDREVGRIIGNEWMRPEISLLRYLR